MDSNAIQLGIADLSRVTDVSPLGKRFSVMEAYCGQLYHYGTTCTDQNIRSVLNINYS